MNAKYDDESLRPRKCSSHPLFFADYCCFDPQCENTVLSCVLCLKSQHSGCGKKFIQPLKNLGEKLQIDRTVIGAPSSIRLEQIFEQKIIDLLQSVAGKTVYCLFQMREKLEQKAKSNLGANQGRFSIENWASVRGDWKVEYLAQNKTIQFTKANRVDAAQLAEYAKNLESFLTKNLSKFIAKIEEPKICQIKAQNLDFWSVDNRIDISQHPDTKFIKIQMNPDAPEDTTSARTWHKTPVENSVYEISIESADAGPVAFDLGLAHDRQMQKMKTSEELKITEFPAVTENTKSNSLSNVTGEGWKVPPQLPFKFYLDLETKGQIFIYDATGGQSLSGKLSSGSSFLFVNVKNKNTKVFIRELI